MGWNNPQMPWRELERTLSGRPAPQRPGDGNDSPAWSRVREPFVPPPITPPADLVPYAELHAHSKYSFLDGASHPEELAEEAARLGLGPSRSPTTTGSTAWCASPRPPRRSGCARSSAPSSASGCRRRRTVSPTRPDATCWCWPAAPRATARLSRAISRRRSCAGGEKGRPSYDLDELAAHRGGPLAGAHRLPQGRGPRTPSPPQRPGGRPARELDRLVTLFGARQRRWSS